MLIPSVPPERSTYDSRRRHGTDANLCPKRIRQRVVFGRRAAYAVTP